MATAVTETRFIVQFCPCGDVLDLTREEYFAMGGSQQQLDDVEAGIKLDAPILPTSQCPQCKSDCEESDRRIELMLDL